MCRRVNIKKENNYRNCVFFSHKKKNSNFVCNMFSQEVKKNSTIKNKRSITQNIHFFKVKKYRQIFKMISF